MTHSSKMKTSPGKLLVIFFSVILLTEYNNDGNSQNLPKETFAKGADISWLPQMEATVYQFYNDNGEKEVRTLK
jgi:arabinogalactan endo-1,4-beta-galactosidase